MNKAILIGNVGKDPEVKTVSTGKKVATVTLATTERGYTLANGNKVDEETTWHNLILWDGNNGNGLASTCERHIKKGQKIAVEGKIKNRSYDAQDGTKRYITEVIVDNLEILTWSESNNTTTNQPAQPIAKNTVQPQPTPVVDDITDDLPF